MALSNERSGQARLKAKTAAAAAYQAHLAEQRSKRWRVTLVDDHWRVAVQAQPGGPWTVLDDALPGVSDVGDLVERALVGAWLRGTVLEVEGLVRDRDHDAAAHGRVAYTVEITR